MYPGKTDGSVKVGKYKYLHTYSGAVYFFVIFAILSLRCSKILFRAGYSNLISRICAGLSLLISRMVGLGIYNTTVDAVVLSLYV